MPRFTTALFALVLVATPLAAQRASMGVSAIILPTASALAAGRAMPRAESGNTVMTSARLSATAQGTTSPKSATVRSVPSATTSYAEFRLDLEVSSNVHYAVAVQSNGDQKVQSLDAHGRFREVTDAPTRVTGSRGPDGRAVSPLVYRVPAKSAPSIPVIVVVTAASIT